MLSKAEINNLDCEKIARDPTLRRAIIGMLRKYFSKHKLDYDPNIDDIDLLGYAKAKYHDRPFVATESRAESEEMHRCLTCLNKIPDFVCSWFKASLIEEYCT